MKAKWVFFDLGDTLVNEDPLRFGLFGLLLDAIKEAGTRNLDFAGLLDMRERAIKEGSSAAHYAIAERMLPAAACESWRRAAREFACGVGMELVHVVPGVPVALERLAERFRLGVIADQPAGIVDRLREWQIGGFFDVVALNSIVGFQKPDTRLYAWALAQAGCSGVEAVMVGNRTDMDIEPAKALGMRTVLCEWPAKAKGWNPATEEGRLYVQSLLRVPNWPSGGVAVAHRVVDDVRALASAIMELACASCA